MADPADIGLLEILSVGDITGDFFVPAYQRGYRWTEHEVRQLLDDIRESNGGTYYLQPVVVKARADGSWELVDGQQRLTTLYLIFQYLARTHLPTAAASYTITYETREGSEDYLDRSERSRRRFQYRLLPHVPAPTGASRNGSGSSSTARPIEATRIYGYLFDHVKVLWYEAPEDVDSTDLFTRLNVGRIPLTDAELVKALLLSEATLARVRPIAPGDRGALGWHRARPAEPRGLGVRDRRGRTRRRPTSASCSTALAGGSRVGVNDRSSTPSSPCGAGSRSDPKASGETSSTFTRSCSAGTRIGTCSTRSAT